jgi:adenosylhomocysteine nucleosidase
MALRWQSVTMADEPGRHVVVLAPMPLEMDAIVAAFGLRPTEEGERRCAGQVGRSSVTAVHIGMGPPATRDALQRLLDEGEGAHIDHVMIAGICGGLNPDVPVGTLINPEVVVDHSSGSSYRHTPPGDEPLSGKLVTTEQATLDLDLSRRFFEEGCIAVDMETAAVAEVCEATGHPWSAYRCIGDRIFDGLLDDRILAMTNPDGSGNPEEMGRLLAEDPGLAERLTQLAHDTSRAARLAAEAAVRGCLALDDNQR